jgi:branched-chain amino acid transport system permease protein
LNPRLLAAVPGAAIALVVADRTLADGLPAGIVVIGLVVGGLYALTAAGLVLVYRATRTLNFAQAELGAIGGAAAVVLSLRWDISWFVAVPAGLAVGALVGVVTQLTVMRRFRDAPAFVKAVATIGVAEILAGVGQVIATSVDTGPGSPLRFPVRMSMSIEPAVLQADHMVAVVAVVGALAGLAIFLFRTPFGIAARASADEPDRARLLGLPVETLGMLTWALAGTLSALTVMLRVPLLGFSSVGSVTGGGSGLLLRALAAAVIGRMEHVPTTVMAAVGIGVLEHSIAWTTPNSTLVDAVLVAVIVIGLLARRQRPTREAGLAWRLVRDARPLREVAGRERSATTRRVAVLAGLAVAVTAPLWLRPSQEVALGLIFLYGLVAVSLVVLSGWAGHLSLGQFAVAGVGGAVTALLVGRHGVDALVAVPAGVAAGAAVAVALSLPALRLRGPFFAVTTLAFAVVASTLLLEERHVPWLVDEDLDRPARLAGAVLERDAHLYLLCLAGLLGGLAVAHRLRWSRFGRVVLAVRDNPRAAAAVGVRPALTRVSAFAVSGALAGLAGALYVIHQQGVRTEAFSPEASLRVFSMAVIGGLGSLPGAVLGAVYVRGVELLLPAAWALLASGAGLLVVLMFLPDGFGGAAERSRNLLVRRMTEGGPG